MILTNYCNPRKNTLSLTVVICVMFSSDNILAYDSRCQNLDGSTIEESVRLLASSNNIEDNKRMFRRWGGETVPVYVASEVNDDKYVNGISKIIEEYNAEIFERQFLVTTSVTHQKKIDNQFLLPTQHSNTNKRGIKISILRDDRFRNLSDELSNESKITWNYKLQKASLCYYIERHDSTTRETFSAVIWIPEKGMKIGKGGCVYQEINHVLGIRNDNSNVDCTVHNGAPVLYDGLFLIDKTVLKILYNRRLIIEKSLEYNIEVIRSLASCYGRRHNNTKREYVGSCSG